MGQQPSSSAEHQLVADACENAVDRLTAEFAACGLSTGTGTGPGGVAVCTREDVALMDCYADCQGDQVR